jgi:ribosomal protein S8E
LSGLFGSLPLSPSPLSFGVCVNGCSPMGLRYKKANVTHPELGVTVQLPILSVKKNPQNPLYTQLGVLTKGTVIEVNVSELGISLLPFPYIYIYIYGANMDRPRNYIRKSRLGQIRPGQQ